MDKLREDIDNLKNEIKTELDKYDREYMFMHDITYQRKYDYEDFYKKLCKILSDSGKSEGIDLPYLRSTKTETEQRYNPDYGDSRICECGHSYYRHFDPYELMENVGCKYCGCDEFKEVI